jgi:DNA ligase 1
MQNLPVDVRTCKHLRETLGDEFETFRCGRAGNAPAKVEKVGAPALLLANKWENQDPTGWWISEKLDGVRAYWDGKRFLSRLGNVFYAPEWFVKDLPSDSTLDGELFGGRKLFQSTVGIVKSQDQSDRWKKLVYKVFDIPSEGAKPFEQRMAQLNKMFPNGSHPYVEVVEQTLCKGKEQVDKELERVQNLGGEGLMLRQKGSKYVGSRSSTLLKVKGFEDEEALVIGYIDGKGKFAGMVGSLQCQLANGKKFNVGSGLSDADHAKPPKIGSVITVRYQELTDGGIPRFPTYLGVRIDVKWPPSK